MNFVDLIMSAVNVNIGHLCNREFVFIQNGSSFGRLFKFCGAEEVVIYMQLISPQFQRHISDWVAGTGQRCVALFAGGEKKQNWKYQNGVSMLYGDPNKAYLSFSHIPIKWQPLTLLPYSNFFWVCVSYFSTTLTVVSAEFFQCWKFFFMKMPISVIHETSF